MREPVSKAPARPAPVPPVPAPQRSEIRRALTGPRLQAKLTVNQPGDDYEKEADRVAEQVTRGGLGPVTAASASDPRVQRCACGGSCDSCRQGEELRRAPASSSPVPSEAPASVHQTLASPGRPLARGIRERLEPRFGADFGSVQIHTDSQSARDVSARAYTVGSHIAFAPGEYAPGTESGDRLLAHELTHVVQQSGSARRLQRDDKTKKKEEETETEAPNPIADWKLSDGSVILIRTDTQMIVVPGGKLVWSPDAKAQTQFEAAKSQLTTDLGALFEVPATGASGTRIFKAGRRTGLLLDAGSNPMRAVPGAVYLNEFQAVMANLGITKLEKVQIIHVHKDHVSEIPAVVGQYNVRAQDLIIPKPYIGTNRDIRQVVTALQGTTDAALVAAGYGPTWNPGTILKDKGGAGDVLRYSYKVGDLVVENVALRSALSTTARNPDLASYLTKVTRTTDQAKVVVLGDLRGSDLATIRTAMEAARSGSWSEFFSGVTTLSGFSHHVGAAKDTDVAGLLSLLDVTLLKTGKLRVVEQTNTAEHPRARADTIEVVKRLGIELVTSEMPAAAGTSAAGATKATVYGRGPAGTAHPTITSDLTAALGRMQKLIAARTTIETWRPWFEEAGGKKAVDDILPEINRSIADLQQGLRPATEAALRVRTGGNATAAGGGRDYTTATGGNRATALDTALRAIPAATGAENALGTKGFQFLDDLRRRPEKDIPLAVALNAAMTRGEYSEKAFQTMLAALDPATRDSLLVGKRGGPTTKQKAFERVRATFGFRSSVLGTGQILSVPRHFSAGAKAATRGVGGFLAFLEIFNTLIVPGVQAYQTGKRTFSSQNLLPFLRRLLFWQQAGVAPKVVGVDEGVTDQTYEKDYAKVIKGLNDETWDALYFDEPGLSDVDVFNFGAWLSYNIRNFDEFALLFKDSGQDAIAFETPEKGGWTKAKWKVRVGRYETSGDNRVIESWYEHPKLTELMQVFTARIIANTQELLKEGAAPSEETQARIGELMGQGRRGTLAKLATPAESTEAEVETLGNDRRSRIKKTIKWWSAPQFHIAEVRGDEARVKGADYNTYAILRSLETEYRELGMGQYGTTHSTSVAGNLDASVWIHMSLLSGIGLRIVAPKGPAL